MYNAKSGESGPGAHPLDVAWVTEIRDQRSFSGHDVVLAFTSVLNFYGCASMAQRKPPL
jgi:protein gp37